MDAIEKIVAQIINKGQEEAAALKEKEIQRIDQEMKAQQTEVIVQEKDLIQKNRQQLNKEFKQKQNRQHLAIRQATLQKKQFYLEQLFAEAVEQMKAWPKAEFQAFVKQTLNQLSLSGDATIILGEASKELLTADWLSLHTPEQMEIRLSEETAAGEGGFILVQAGIEYNFLFSSLVEEVKMAESFQLAEQLFSE
ncbi:V-type ATP synthase subunit E [Enterococcus sp. UD-01]|jgi:V/A-type H+-transporting ATPase subunit E|uniref:V-type ATP synthase subunit E n=1 Tax=Enterococcus sp. UD-01 TaxID=3373911 RepID=UPI003834F7D3